MHFVEDVATPPRHGQKEKGNYPIRAHTRFLFMAGCRLNAEQATAPKTFTIDSRAYILGGPSHKASEQKRTPLFGVLLCVQTQPDSRRLHVAHKYAFWYFIFNLISERNPGSRSCQQPPTNRDLLFVHTEAGFPSRDAIKINRLNLVVLMENW